MSTSFSHRVVGLSCLTNNTWWCAGFGAPVRQWWRRRLISKKRGTPTQRADLAKHDLISLLSAPHAWHFEAEEEVLPVAPRVLAGSASFARELCLRGSGVAILPEFLVAADIAAGTLAELHAGARRASKQVFAVFPRESGTCRPCALFSISSTPHSTSVTRR